METVCLFLSRAAKGDVDTQVRWQLTWEVSHHAAGEEIVVYPLLEKHLGAEGRQLVDHDRADHQVRSKRIVICLTIVQRVSYRSSRGSSKSSSNSLGTTEHDDTPNQFMDHF